MADEELPKTIRDSIEDAIETVGEPEADAPRPAPRPAPAPEKERDELEEGIEERPRDEKGRFLPRGEGEPEEEKPEAPAKPAPKQQEGEPEKAPVEEPAKPADETREQKLAKIVKNWRPEQREFLAKQSPDVQQFLIDRDTEMTAAFTRKTQEVAYLKNEYGPIHQMLEPELPAMKAAGYTPRLLIEGWAAAERALLSGPQQAAQTLRAVAEGYQIPREVVAAAFGFDPRTPEQLHRIVQGGAPAAQPNGNGATQPGEFRDPRVDLMIQERQENHERELIQRHQQYRNAAYRAQAEIDAFREETDSKGNLLHPYFAECEGHMLALAKFAGENTGKLPPLKELYESAVNANPATRARVLADAERAQSEKRRQAEAARGKADMARKASSSVVGMGSGRPTNRTQEKQLPKGASVRASIDAAFDQVVGDQE